MRTSTKGFNLVEILITLSIVALLTTMVLNAVTDYKDRVRMVRVKSDLMTIAEACKYVEATERTLIVTLSETGTEVASDISNYLIRLPSEDPWGRRFRISASGTVSQTGGLGPAYIIDRGMGRIISPGPDGICDTKLGFGPSDRDRDIVVEFRQVPWIVYNIFTASHPAGAIFMARGDGSLLPELIVNGARNMQVSADRRLMCFMTAAGLQWGFVDRSPVLKSILSGPAIVGAGLYPFWAPDNVHIVVMSGGHLFSVNSDSGKCIQLTHDTTPPIGDSQAAVHVTAGTGYRTFFNDGQVSYLHHPVANGLAADVFITVSLDGKVAYLNLNHQGIDMVLLDGTGHRTIKQGVLLPVPGLWYRPLFWMSSEVLVYMKPVLNLPYLARIKQDGSYDMNLWSATQVVNSVSLIATLNYPLVSVSPSPDRSMVLLYSLVPHPNGGYRVVKTDGSGCVPDSLLGMINANNGGGPITWAVPLWKRNQECVFLPGANPANVRGLIFSTASGVPLWDQAVGPITTNDLTGYAPCAWDLDRNNTLIAMISATAGVSAGTPGVFVYPVNGPDDAITKLGGEAPDPSVGTMFSIFWLR